MQRHFHDELKSLRQDLLRMGLLVEDTIRTACDALMAYDLQKAREVMQNEQTINRLEIEIDEKGHELMALEQPVAIDLRRLTMILKINTNLERMGDHAVNIAKRVQRMMTERPDSLQSFPLEAMADASHAMLKNALDSFVNEDVELARHVLASDDEVDNYNDEIYFKVRDIMKEHSDMVEFGINVLMITYNLERIADLAGNIAEDVIYIKLGKEVKHHFEELTNL